ncbi:MAG: methionyl-tRNA formyltransferase [Candidatus Omnitrophica bacterium]|nr:methionyl-tRNA formyltransferase [Candidatus Omnitrophota bacterium]MCM8798151.1 methionyl-tRNA formyltransferase [Candidatus Omnitrophota bacterium]
MKIVFWGTSSFALPTLEKIARSKEEILLVVTQPDKKQGRHLKLIPPPVKIKAEELNLKVVQPDSLSDKNFLSSLKELEPDLFVVVAYGNILKREILQIPRIISLNLHASLLPKYRGPAPINWAIWKGEKETGVSIIKMNEKMDAGEIILQKKIPISEEDNALSLGERLSREGADLCKEAIDLLAQGKAKFLPQEESKASFAPLLKKEDGKIDWRNSAREISRQIRALLPWPGSYCFYKQKLLKIWKASAGEEDFSGFSPGEIVEIGKEEFAVATGKGKLWIKELQLAGGRRMSAREFLSGHPLQKGEIWQ